MPAPAPSTAVPSALPVIDPAIRQELEAVGGPDLPVQLLAMFLEDAPRQLAAVRGALNTGDHAVSRANAHSMKGAAASIGACRVEATAKAVEHAARSGEDQKLPALVDLLEAALTELKNHRD